jgi:teichoic acid transport system permease protein
VEEAFALMRPAGEGDANRLGVMTGAETDGPAGSLSGPGSLTGTTATAVHSPLPAEPLADLAAEYGLRRAAVRPPLLVYLRQLWRRRAFIIAFATARNIAMYTEARLGQLWQVLTPLLNAAVYWLVFGLLLHVSRGIPDYIPFLVTGIFVFTFTQRSFLLASRVINDHLQLIRALHFPRACLPLGFVVVELQQLLLSMLVLAVIVLSFGEPLTWYWLLIIPALLVQTLFNVGAGLIIARIGAGVTDLSQLLPFVLRTWLYVSGVLYSIRTLSIHSYWVKWVLSVNPAAVYIQLVRDAILTSQRLSAPGAMPYNAHLCALFTEHASSKSSPYNYDSAYCAPIIHSTHLWFYGIAWAVVAVVVGFWVFWRAEERYGRG